MDEGDGGVRLLWEMLGMKQLIYPFQSMGNGHPTHFAPFTIEIQHYSYFIIFIDVDIIGQAGFTRWPWSRLNYRPLLKMSRNVGSEWTPQPARFPLNLTAFSGDCDCADGRTPKRQVASGRLGRWFFPRTDRQTETADESRARPLYSPGKARPGKARQGQNPISVTRRRLRSGLSKAKELLMRRWGRAVKSVEPLSKGRKGRGGAAWEEKVVKYSDNQADNKRFWGKTLSFWEGQSDPKS